MVVRPHFVDSRHTDGGEAGLTPWPAFVPMTVHGTLLGLRLSQPQGHTAAGRIRLIEKIQ
jgi:hypothetical protein